MTVQVHLCSVADNSFNECYSYRTTHFPLRFPPRVSKRYMKLFLWKHPLGGPRKVFWTQYPIPVNCLLISKHFYKVYMLLCCSLLQNSHEVIVFMSVLSLWISPPLTSDKCSLEDSFLTYVWHTVCTYIRMYIFGFFPTVFICLCMFTGQAIYIVGLAHGRFVQDIINMYN